MATTILDGSGSNLRAKVASDGQDNRLLVGSESTPLEGARAVLGKSGIAHAKCVFGASTSGGLLALTNNSQTEDMDITRIYFDAHALAAPVQIVQVKAPTTVTGGTDLSTTGIIQKNYGSLVTPSVGLVAAQSGAALSYTGGEEYHNFALSSLQSQQRNMNLTNIIAPGTTILWGFETTNVGGHAMGAAETIGISVNFVMVER